MSEQLAALQLAQASTDPDLAQLVAAASPAQQQALLRALQEAHATGQQEAEARTGRIIAQVLAPLLGVAQPTAGGKGSSHRLSRIVGLLRGSAR